MTMPGTLGIGLFFDLRNPAQWARHSADHVARTFDVIGHAESVGADSVWFTEHHQFGDGYLSQPLTFAAAVAGRTSRVRIGTAVVLAPLRHPLDIAEQAAVVDAVSGGRLELGLGPGYAPAEFATFGADRDKRFGRTDAVAAQVRDLLARGGDADSPLGAVPVQNPVPLWLGYQGPQNAKRAGRLGAGLLSLRRPAVASYLDSLVESGFPSSDARVAGCIDVIVSDDPERAWQLTEPHYRHQLISYAAAAGGGPVDEQAFVGRFGETRPVGLAVRLSVLSPDEAIAFVSSAIDGLPVQHVYTWASIAGMPDDVVDEHVELWLTRVAPALRRTAS